MRQRWRRRLGVGLLGVVGALPLLFSTAQSGAAAPPNPPPQHPHVAVCPGPAAPGTARCHAHRRTDSVGTPDRQASVRPDVLGNNGAYDPGFLRSAYNLTAASSSGGAGQTVAIVDAYDDPNAESDLAAYRSYFGLPACSSASGCFSKLNQTGAAGPYPAADSGWAQEISLDLDMVSAICPSCHIVLVEASSASFADLGTAENTAAARGATAISNSYGGREWSGEGSVDAAYTHPGIAITVSSGDNGYGVEYPAASAAVTAVGGTTLQQATNTGTRNATETVWSGAGSGCSAYEAKPGWQHDGGCSHRTVADVAADADPNTGVWVYDTYQGSGWAVFGGTSVAAPIIASVYALAGNAASVNAGYSYSQRGALNDITSGSNGSCGRRTTVYLCHGEPGYDGPTGNGTPNGAGAF